MPFVQNGSPESDEGKHGEEGSSQGQDEQEIEIDSDEQREVTSLNTEIWSTAQEEFMQLEHDSDSRSPPQSVERRQVRADASKSRSGSNSRATASPSARLRRRRGRSVSESSRFTCPTDDERCVMATPVLPSSLPPAQRRRIARPGTLFETGTFVYFRSHPYADAYEVVRYIERELRIVGRLILQPERVRYWRDVQEVFIPDQYPLVHEDAIDARIGLWRRRQIGRLGDDHQ